MRTATVYVAFDGQRFPSEEACLAHENSGPHIKLVGLSVEQVLKGISGEDKELAGALELIGARIGDARRAAGNFKPKGRGAKLVAAAAEASATAAGGNGQADWVEQAGHGRMASAGSAGAPAADDETAEQVGLIDPAELDPGPHSLAETIRAAGAFADDELHREPARHGRKGRR